MKGNQRLFPRSVLDELSYSGEPLDAETGREAKAQLGYGEIPRYI
jgi:hypothetical protein